MKGVVFRDFDLNGSRSDTLPIEAGVSGITVRAFVDLNKTPVSTTSGPDGTYFFSSTDAPAGQRIRIEFDNFPAGNYTGPAGTGSGTSVQFAKAPAENVNLGINYPADYCQRTGVRLIVPCYVNGSSQTDTLANGDSVSDEKQAAKADALVAVAYEANGIASGVNFPPDHLAAAGQVGSVWAMAYQRRTKKVFSAAVVKRHMSFGPLGTGGIYITDVVAKTTTNFLNVNTIGINTGDDPHSRLFADKTKASADPGSMTAMGRISFGGMDMSEDDKTLYVMNLTDRKLYALFVDSPARLPADSDVKSWAIPNPGCSNGDFRPWAVRMYHGKLYIGVICSAETSQQQRDLKATIYRFDPTAPAPAFEEVLAFPLDFRRGSADSTGTCAQYDHWLPWTDAWPTPCGTGSEPFFVMYPQPILTDLEFDDDGSMMIGFLDRFGHLSGVSNHDPNGNGFYDGFTGGDLLRAYNNNGTFDLEKNGKAGPLTGNGVGNSEGPVDAAKVGGEFYAKDEWFFVDHIAHDEIMNGALAFIPGYNEIITSAYDPIANVYQSGGLKVFNARTGAENRSFVLYTLHPGAFGKASGLGDTKALCDPATVEIGNRLWFDDNRDGIQDAYEPGVDGLVLTLHDMGNGGTLIATQTTHDGGQFYFNNSTVPGGLNYGHPYEIRMDTTQLSVLDITLAGTQPLLTGQRYYSLSPANRADFAAPDLRDSDAGLTGGSAVIAVITLDAGQNDFTNDLGIYSCPALTNEKDTVMLCPRMTLDSIVTVGSHLSRVDSVRFVLFSSPQSGTAMYGNDGIVLGTVKPDSSTKRAMLYNPSVNLVNNTAGILHQYIYAIIYPTPQNPACRPSDITLLKLAPALSASATGGQLTCTVEKVTLTGQALYGDGTAAAGAVYAWTGPNNFAGLAPNPTVSTAGTYTLTVSDPACPNGFTTATTDVISNTISPVMTTSLVAKTCPGCMAIMSADCPEAILSWTGPNSYTATGSPIAVMEDGTYTVTATAGNGCVVVASLQIIAFECPPPGCVAIRFIRLR
ncbi:hypothetical protein GCM10027190_50480 [Spirosoma areae]